MVLFLAPKETTSVLYCKRQTSISKATKSSVHLHVILNYKLKGKRLKRRSLAFPTKVQNAELLSGGFNEPFN